MKKIIEFFNSLFGKKWEYVPTEYASPIEQLVEAKTKAKKETKKKPAAKKVAKKTAKKKTK